ncbi:MAG: NAD-dependent epimerase/dehydratase family protein [Crocinitomicaceae bacterium]
MKKILVTGGAGNVGSALVEGLLNKGYYVVVVDNLSTGSLDKLPQSTNLKFIKCDCNNYRDLAEVMLAFDFEFVFHYAAVVGVKRTQENPVSVLNDIKGIENLLNLSKNTQVKRVFFSSSSEVYGEPVELPQHETRTPLNSRVPYAVVKNVGESFFRSYKQEFGLDYTIFRFFNTYGPNQSEDFVVAKFLRMAMNNEDITIYGDGKQTRTFCYVSDNVETCIKIMEEALYVNDVINIGGADIWTIQDLAEKIIEITGSNSKIIYVDPLKEGDMARRQPDNTKMLNVLGRDLITLEEGVKKMIKFYKNQQ